MIGTNVGRLERNHNDMNDGTSMRASNAPQGTEAATSVAEGSTNVSTDVVVAVAEKEGVDAVELDDRLHDWVDPEALDAVVASMDDGQVEFQLADYRIRVRSNGRIFIEE
jgi:hypothetical protein